MFKNKKVVLSSVAIIFTLIVSAIFVNFTLANSKNSVKDTEAETYATTSLVGYSNIDLAIINSNNANLKTSGEDKFRILQILPDSLEAYATTDTAMTSKVTASGYKGTISKEADYSKTSDLWKYVYDGEYFRYAVFDGYKTISAKMAAGAVKLTTMTVSQLNTMDDAAQTALSEADFIYIVATKYDDYGNGSTDISEDVYNLLDAYATTDNHPMVIDKYALCVSDPSTIKGNNDTYRMGALAYKVMTKTYVSRYDNVLVTDYNKETVTDESGNTTTVLHSFFSVLYDEAKGGTSGNSTMQSTTKTISDFILAAENKEADGGKGYMYTERYYKWFTDDSLVTFLSHKSTHAESAYAYVEAGKSEGKTGSKTTWDFDNANVLIISDGTSSDMYTTLKAASSSTASADDYVFNNKNQTWESVEKAPNSIFTSNAYYTGASGTYRYVPSGANIFQIDASLLEKGISTGVTFTNAALSSSGFKDVITQTVTGEIKSSAKLTGTKIYLVVDDNGVKKFAGIDETPVTYTLSDDDCVEETDENGAKTGNYIYTYSFPKLNTEYTFSAVIAPKVASVSQSSGSSNTDTDTDVDTDTDTAAGTDTDTGTDTGAGTGTDTDVDAGNGEEGNIDATGNGNDNPDSSTNGDGDTTTPDEGDEGPQIMAVEDDDNAETPSNEDGSGNTSSEDNEITTPVDDYTVGVSKDGFSFIITLTDETQDSAYDYTKDDDTYGEFNNKAETAPDSYNKDEYVTSNISFETAEQVYDYVNSLYKAYQTEVLKSGINKDTTKVINFEDYDFVFIDKGTYHEIVKDADGKDAEKSIEIGENVYKALCSAVEDGVYFIVSSDAGDGIGSGSGDGDDGKVDNTLNIYSPSANLIAAIINAGVYRDGSDNKFRVLEIQPDYPIDTELAETGRSGGTSYTKHSDETSFTGNYYTVPSDVVSGKAKEELADGTEYYQFDLTKAKIANAIDGVSYSQIELTQVSTEALIGMTEDISATYDLVYIGGDISAKDISMSQIYSYYTGNSDVASSLSLAVPTFIMYTHTGILQQLDSSTMPALLTNNAVYVPENGNDLTKEKYQQLVNYVASGRPVIMSSELTTVYEKMNGLNVTGGNVGNLSEVQLLNGYWYKNDGSLERKNYYLDPSSRMYDLVEAIYNRKNTAGNTNVLWGLNPNENMEQNKNADGSLGATENAGYAVVYNEATSTQINNLVKGSSSRTRLTVTNKPVTYKQGIKSTYLNTTNLSYTFNVAGTADTYRYTVCVDKDKNTVFDTEPDSSGNYTDYVISGSCASGVDKTVSVALDSDFFGSAYWQIQITDSADKVVAVKTGICKIVNTTEEKREINVLQVVTNYKNDSNGGTSYQNPSDMLYFDIMSQFGHQILYYNAYSTQNTYGTEANELVQTSVLGRHENRFGIVEYDYSHISSRNPAGIGDDDWLSNLADVLTDDYDISLDMAVATADHAAGKTWTYDCLDTWSAEADTLKNGGKVADSYTGNSYTQAEYLNMAGDALADYENNQALVVEPKKALDAYIKDTIDNGTKENNDLLKKLSHVTVTEAKEMLQYVLDSGEYSLIFLMYYTNEGEPDLSSYGEFGKLFIKYRDAKDAELNAKDKYQTYLRRSYGKDFLKEMYTILILGPSNDFGGNEIDLSMSSCNYIKDYVENGGDLFFFHDTMTSYNDKGSVNLTKTLLDVVGMNRYHVDMTDQKNSYTATYKVVLEYVNSTTSEGWVYTQQNKDSHPAGMVNTTTLPDSGYIYTIESYDFNRDNSYNGINGWEKAGDYEYGPNWNSGEKKTFYRKLASQCTSSELRYHDFYVYKEAETYEKINGQYFSKEWMPAGSSGYVEKQTTNVDGYEYDSTNSGLYYLTPYANNPSLNETGGLYSSMMKNLAGTGVQSDQYSSSGWDISALSTTTMTFARNKNLQGEKWLPYIYAQMDENAANRGTTSDGNRDESGYSQTANASQLNEGLITLYPFSISDKLNISATHQQAYSLDLENSNTTVWYTLAGCNNSGSESQAKVMSSFFAADPYDGTESYFIYTTSYQKGTITYCGAGHTSITGWGTKNNDERKLFINVIVNSAAAVVPKPEIKVYEPDTNYETEMSKDEEVLQSTGKTLYTTDVDTKTDSPNFDFKVTVPNDVNVSKVRIYYDLDYSEDFSDAPTYREKDANNNALDVLIKEYTTSDPNVDITADFNDMVRDANTGNKLKLKDEYFAAYGGTHTYIVVEVTYKGGRRAYAMIKVKASDPLFELTQGNTYNSVNNDVVDEKKYVLA